MGDDLDMLDAEMVGDISDTVTDYDYGEKQVIQLRTFYESLGRPAEFRPAFDAVEAAYEDARAWLGDKMLKWKNATKMKLVGADASKLMAELQGAYRTKAAAVPSGSKSDVYDPNAPKPKLPSLPDSGFLKYVPWIIGGAVVIGVGAVAAPIVVPLLAHRTLAKRLS